MPASNSQQDFRNELERQIRGNGSGGVVNAFEAVRGARRFAGEQQQAQFGIEGLQGDIQQLFQAFINSPAGQQQLAQANQLGGQVQSSIATNLGRSGLSKTGVGAVRGGLAAGAGAGAKLGVQSGFFNQAAGAAQQNLAMRFQGDLQKQLLQMQQQFAKQQSGGIGGFLKNLGGNFLGGIPLLGGAFRGAGSRPQPGASGGNTFRI